MDIDSVLKQLENPKYCFLVKTFVEKCFEEKKRELLLARAAVEASGIKLKQPNRFELNMINIEEIIFISETSIEVIADFFVTPKLNRQTTITFSIPSDTILFYKGTVLLSWQDLIESSKKM